MRRFASLATFLLGCGSVVSVPAGTEGGDGSTSAAGTSSVPSPSTSTSSPLPGSSTTPLTTNPTTNSTTDPDPTTATATASTSTSTTGPTTFGSTTDPGCQFLCPPDVGDTSNECDIWDPDCPRGQKCTAWNNTGGEGWNANRCVDVVDDPAGIGEPCIVEDAATSGIDDCDFGSICLADPETLQGTCSPFCQGPEVNPSCPDDRVCIASGETVLPLCLPECDPLDPICADDQGCYPVGEVFVCAWVNGDVGTFESCDFANACAPGSACMSTDVVAACPGGSDACCTPFCDLNAPACPDPTACVPFYDVPMPGLEDVGICGDSI